MPETAIRHIVFDLGNVLIQWDPEHLYKRLIPDDAARADFMHNVCSHAWNLEQDRGRDWREAETILIAEFPDKEDLIRAYRLHWHEMVIGPIDGSVKLLERFLAGGWDVTALTNFAADTIIESKERFPFLNRFRHMTVSADIGLVKPEADIYHHHVTAAGLDPAACFFIDDSLANVEAARAAGWQAHQFFGAEDFEHHVTQVLGLNPDQAPSRD